VTSRLLHDLLVTLRASAQVKVDQASDQIGSPPLSAITPSYEMKNGSVLTIMVSAKVNAQGGALSRNSLLASSCNPTDMP
jgi:hypothetical protein